MRFGPAASVAGLARLGVVTVHNFVLWYLTFDSLVSGGTSATN